MCTTLGCVQGEPTKPVVGVTDRMIQRPDGIQCHRDISGSREAVGGWNAPDTRKPLHLSIYIGMSERRTEQVEAALRTWSQCIVMTTEHKPFEQAQLRFVFDAIDGPGGVLAQAHYPRQPQAGLIVLDSAEDWDAIDLQAAALHELGHAIGLGHEYTDNSAVMFWIFRGTTRLSWLDVLAAKQLYLVRFLPPLGGGIWP